MSPFSSALTFAESTLIAGLDTPLKIQEFLDTLLYSAEDRYRAPLTVLRDRSAHCYDGAVFAAALLRRLGHPPLIVDMLPNERDDDHLLALFKRDGHWGAVAKSNYSGLRYREPIHRTLRELVLSYFEDYFNPAGEKTLRAYTVPLNLARFDRLEWEARDEALDAIADRLDQIRKITLLTPAMIANLAPVDPRSLAAGLMGANPAGLFKF
ncbi:MAG: hypothetical protein IT318_01275 [Anaerolineales bacterium]|nr:hypothetical protein [Anaerolineales bacterium]